MVDITKESVDNVYLIKIVGDVDAASSIYLDKAVSEGVQKNFDKLVIDCSELEYISSAGLGVFMSYIQDFRESGAQMVLFGLNDRVANVFDILGLNQLLTIVDTKEEALTRVSNEV
jgi:anti-sigma B factor antagonist